MTSQAASSSTSGRFYLANTHVPKGFHLPGITDDARHALAECLEDDYNHVPTAPLRKHQTWHGLMKRQCGVGGCHDSTTSTSTTRRGSTTT